MSDRDLDIEFRNRLKYIMEQFRDKSLPAYATFIDGNGYYVAKVTSVNIIPPMRKLIIGGQKELMIS